MGLITLIGGGIFFAPIVLGGYALINGYCARNGKISTALLICSFATYILGIKRLWGSLCNMIGDLHNNSFEIDFIALAFIGITVMLTILSHICGKLYCEKHEKQDNSTN